MSNDLSPDQVSRVPSNNLLRTWAVDPENEMCWGLDTIADERESQARLIAELEAELAKIAKGASIKIPTNTMEQEFQSHYRRGYEAGKASVETTDRQVLYAKPTDLHTHSPDCRGSGCVRVYLDGLPSVPPDDELAEYLKEGESPLQCIKRNRADVDTVLTLLAKEKRKTENPDWDTLIAMADKFTLPTDAKIGAGTFCKGVKVGTFLRSVQNHERLAAETSGGQS